MDATALSLEAQLNNERQRCAALEAAQRDLEAACQEALDDAKRSDEALHEARTWLLYTSPSPRDATLSRMPSSA